ncbi:MAG: rhomboid family intramembrane serine protease [Verrucomicrobiota bacterium]
MTSNASIEPITETEEWVQVGHYPTLEQAYDHGLVILAMGESCQVTEAATPGEFDLHAEALPAGRISVELDAYGKDAALPVARSPIAGEWTRHSPGWAYCGNWMIVLMAVFYWQGQDSTLVERAAASNVGLIERGEWWRPFTALFLHADLGHLVGNLLSGLVFGTLVSRMIGPLLGWALILGCGTLGNIVTSRLTYPEAFTSIGASSAVFAALGILSGLGVAETLRDRARLPWLRISAPFLAGLILLGWLGGGGGHGTNTDVLGHVFGFSTGLVAGVATGALEEKHATVRI